MSDKVGLMGGRKERISHFHHDRAAVSICSRWGWEIGHVDGMKPSL